MATRIQVVLDEGERELFRRRASREGLSLSAWLRRAGRRQVVAAETTQLRDVRDLKAFFAGCDARERGREPSWSKHLQTMARSRRQGTKA